MNPKILMVDDDGDGLAPLERALRAAGYEVARARGVGEAREILEHEPIDAVLSELTLPGASGMELLKALTRTGNTVPRFIVTDRRDPALAVEALKNGAEDFLLKPVDPERLLRLLQNALVQRNMAMHNQQLAYKWQVTFDVSPDLIAILDGSHLIVRGNVALAQALGRDKSELIGRPIYEFLPALRTLKHALGADGLGNEEVHNLEFNDEQLHKCFLLTTAPLRDTRENTWGLVLFMRDMTDYKKMQRQLLHSQKMESIGTLAAGVAHEINNPVGFIHSNLNSLNRYLERIKEYTVQCGAMVEAAPGLSAGELARQAQGLAEMRRRLKIDTIMADLGSLIEESREGTERICKIVANLKGLARRDESTQKCQNLNERLDGVLHLTWNELKYKTTVVKDYGDLPRVPCSMDLDQVFVNLLINAVQAIPDKGEIRIKTWTQESMACVGIRDTGSGIPEDVLPHIFEPFFTTKPVGQGTGLGLSISYDIVTKHGGELTVESTPGKGSTFTVKLPIESPRHSPDGIEAEDPDRGAPAMTPIPPISHPKVIA